jgi:hypothetical protein
MKMLKLLYFLAISTYFLFVISCSNQYKNVSCNEAKLSVYVADYKTDTTFLVKRFSADGTFTTLIDSSYVKPIFLKSSGGIEIATDTVGVENFLANYDYSITIPSAGITHKIYALKDDGIKTQRVNCKNGDCPPCFSHIVSYAVDGISMTVPANFTGVYLSK